jgi:hypothetical protein
MRTKEDASQSLIFSIAIIVWVRKIELVAIRIGDDQAPVPPPATLRIHPVILEISRGRNKGTAVERDEQHPLAYFVAKLLGENNLTPIAFHLGDKRRASLGVPPSFTKTELVSVERDGAR